MKKSLWPWLVLLVMATSATAETLLVIDEDHLGAVINPNVYGQFMEHVGRGIYEGIWVGKDSAIPNINGYRKDVVAALKALHVPVLRWPGGCFADEYHWQDGIGPREQRRVTVNTNWGGVTDDNAFGTHEFLDFAELIGAKVYVNGNLGTGSAQEMAQWLEYMTSDSQSSLARLRRSNGRDKPWKIDYFAIGNEAWGCGGNMSPAYYTDLYRHVVSFLKTPADNTPELIASGGHTGLVNWTDYLVQHVPEVRMDAIGHHYYTLPSGNWKTNKGPALGFTVQDWYSTLFQTLHIDGFIKANLQILDKYDPGKKIGFYVDEWGAWYDPAAGTNPGFLYQQNSLRDAVLASLNFNIFHQYAERVRMTNIAQMVNVLQAMILTDKGKMVLTPTYHVFRMYVPFQGATSLPLSLQGNQVYRNGESSVPKISATAARGKDRHLYVALTNTDPVNAESVVIKAAHKLNSAKGQLLTHKDIDGHNTFEQPEQVKPVASHGAAKQGSIVLELPAKAVAVYLLA